MTNVLAAARDTSPALARRADHIADLCRALAADVDTERAKQRRNAIEAARQLHDRRQARKAAPKPKPGIRCPDRKPRRRSDRDQLQAVLTDRGHDVATIRAWAVADGRQVGGQGRIALGVLQAYAAAHGGVQ